MPKVLSITFLVLAPILTITVSAPKIYDKVGEAAVWITAVFLAIVGSYYVWIKPKGRRKWLLIPPVLLAVFIIPLIFSAALSTWVFPEPPFAPHVAAQKLTELEEKLQQRDSPTGISTLADYAIKYESIIEDLDIADWVDWGPAYYIRPPMAQIDFPPLAQFYGESRDLWKGYLSLRSEHVFDPYILDALSQKYEKMFPELDAVLFLWGEKNTLASKEATEIVVKMANYYGISKDMLPAYKLLAGKELWETWERWRSLQFFEEAITDRVKAYGWKERFGY